MQLPPATGSRVQHVGRLPIGALPAGTYELRIRVTDGGQEMSRTAFFTLTSSYPLSAISCQLIRYPDLGIAIAGSSIQLISSC